MSGNQDPRFKNEIVSGETIFEYLQSYSQKVQEGLLKVEESSLNQAFTALKTCIQTGSRIYVAGNGGSAAISDHLCCDWLKGTSSPGRPHMRTFSLISNTALATAIANDFGYDKMFSRQLEMVAEKNDLAILISSSGNSPNIIAAASKARELGMKIIGMSGFSGGALKDLADISLYVPVSNYGIVEDAHQSLMHVLAQKIALWQDSQSR